MPRGSRGYAAVSLDGEGVGSGVELEAGVDAGVEAGVALAAGASVDGELSLAGGFSAAAALLRESVT